LDRNIRAAAAARISKQVRSFRVAGGHKIKTPPPPPAAEQHQCPNKAQKVAGLAWALPLITSIRVIGRCHLNVFKIDRHCLITALWIM
jgi:hypothetical protein